MEVCSNHLVQLNADTLHINRCIDGLLSKKRHFLVWFLIIQSCLCHPSQTSYNDVEIELIRNHEPLYEQVILKRIDQKVDFKDNHFQPFTRPLSDQEIWNEFEDTTVELDLSFLASNSIDLSSINFTKIFDMKKKSDCISMFLDLIFDPTRLAVIQIIEGQLQVQQLHFPIFKEHVFKENLKFSVCKLFKSGRPPHLRL